MVENTSLYCPVKTTQLENAIRISRAEHETVHRSQYAFHNHILIQKIKAVQVTFPTVHFKILLKLVIHASPEGMWKDSYKAVANSNEPNLVKM